jgi:hypothetical protein
VIRAFGVCTLIYEKGQLIAVTAATMITTQSSFPFLLYCVCVYVCE